MTSNSLWDLRATRSMEPPRKNSGATGVNQATTLRAIWRRCPRVLRAAAIQAVQDLSRPSTANRRAIVLLLGFAVL